MASFSTALTGSQIDSYFDHIIHCAYDKAKEFVEKERERCHHRNLLNCLALFAVAEKTYMSLSFLSPKGFLNRDSVKTFKVSLENLLCDLSRFIEESPEEQVNDQLMQFAKCLQQFLSLRLKLVDFYEQLFVMGMGKQMFIDEVVPIINDIFKNSQLCFQHAYMSSLKLLFSLECESVIHLLLAQLDIQKWKFLSSLLHLNEAGTKLTRWGSMIHTKEVRQWFGRSTQDPALYMWLCKLKSSLVAKFSLYFHEILSKQTSSQEMKSLCAKLQPSDYFTKIQQFHKKSDARAVCLVLDAHHVDEYRGHGYHLPNKMAEPPKGLESYPGILCYPDFPDRHWPNVIMIMNNKAVELSSMDRPVYFFDRQVESTYYLSQIDPLVTLVVIFTTKKLDRDAYIVNFMYDLSLLLRCNKVFVSLKPGTK